MKENKIPPMPKIELTKKQILRKKNLLNKPVKQISINEHSDFTTLIEAFANSSFEARNLGKAAELYQKHIQNDTEMLYK